jgi:hypothetical protein
MTMNSTTTSFSYYGNVLIVEYTSSNNLEKRYLHSVGENVPIMKYHVSVINSTKLGTEVNITGNTVAGITIE